jgi:hypothetical protein
MNNEINECKNCLKQLIEQLIEQILLKERDDHSEATIENLIITPILIYCFLEKILQRKEMSIKYRVSIESKNTTDILIECQSQRDTIIEVKKKFNEKSNEEKLIYPGPFELEKSIQKPAIIFDEKYNFYNLNKDDKGQIIRYGLEHIKKKDKDVKLVLTNGKEWIFLKLKKDTYNKIKDGKFPFTKGTKNKESKNFYYIELEEQENKLKTIKTRGIEIEIEIEIENKIDINLSKIETLHETLETLCKELKSHESREQNNSTQLTS